MRYNSISEWPTWARMLAYVLCMFTAEAAIAWYIIYQNGMSQWVYLYAGGCFVYHIGVVCIVIKHEGWK